MPIKDDPRSYTWGRRKRNLFLWIGGGLILVIGLSVAGYFVFRGDSTNTNTQLTNTPTSNTYRRVLDGVTVAKEEANLFPWAVMVENYYTTRPQAGLTKAGVVYEALAEGGITRFLLIFATHENIEAIGPVRSARPYYVDWAREYDAMYVHVGGSQQALQRIKDTGIKDFNQFFNSGAFKLLNNKVQPHHMFTDSRLLTFGARDEGYPKTGDFEGWTFADDPPLDVRPVTPQTITVDFSSENYEVQYVYDRATNSYLRSAGGKDSLDENGDQRVAPKNVVLQFVTIGMYDEQRLNITTTGSGKAIIYRDGTKIEGTWKKEKPESRTFFYDADGKEMVFTAGQTWVEVLEKDRQNYSDQ